MVLINEGSRQERRRAYRSPFRTTWRLLYKLDIHAAGDGALVPPSWNDCRSPHSYKRKAYLPSMPGNLLRCTLCCLRRTLAWPSQELILLSHALKCPASPFSSRAGDEAHLVPSVHHEVALHEEEGRAHGFFKQRQLHIPRGWSLSTTGTNELLSTREFCYISAWLGVSLLTCLSPRAYIIFVRV